MPVYVDNARIPYRRMLMCHMLADTTDELHQMADNIGVDRRHFQSKAKYPHYDICLSKRRNAVKAGAIECTRRELYAVMQRLK